MQARCKIPVKNSLLILFFFSTQPSPLRVPNKERKKGSEKSHKDKSNWLISSA